MKFTKNELNLMRYAMEDLMYEKDARPEFKNHVDEIMKKIDGMLG